ncbi:hypothetical protein IST455A_00994 [Burkholderia multivorans]|uniref:hypothetical protein n=1 Tax=Burkholderia multivorans TaxID=87883 RepID=UPI00123C1E01|nr:hypothetical protein [Burkholderia multivorans]MBU9247678.1 hypothetical protein [Burkholderia multivorans]QET31701.1 hypothetical protein FOB31_18800 [Burkholderia multivorans]QET40879.1 hypothetical protein FOB30_25060 [Burkholderia multivorans]CAB5280177.1 hypothetical protein IST495A_03488 [Burkholderia multivorans]CAB5300550.1 hypothetical protein IST419_01121 [Burkholderia multivorans]
MQNQTQPRRTLGVRDEYRTRAATLADEQPDFHLRQQRDERPQDRDGGARRPAPAEQWSQQFETRCLVVVGDPFPGQTGRPSKFFAKHVIGAGDVLGTVVVRFKPWLRDLPSTGDRLEVAGSVGHRNNPRGAPMACFTVARWHAK